MLAHWDRGIKSSGGCYSTLSIHVTVRVKMISHMTSRRRRANASVMLPSVTTPIYGGP